MYIFLSTLHVFVVVVVVAVICACFCYIFFVRFLSLFTSFSLCVLRLAIWCCFMLNNVRICIIWCSKHVVPTKAKILSKKRENLPLTTCIYLSQVRCVSFIVYHTHIWSFHSILLPFACSLHRQLSSLHLLPPSCLSFNRFSVRFLPLVFVFFFFPQVYSFGFLHSSSWESHIVWHLFPIVAQELRLLSLSIQRIRKHAEEDRNGILKMELSAF